MGRHDHPKSSDLALLTKLKSRLSKQQSLHTKMAKTLVVEHVTCVSSQQQTNTMAHKDNGKKFTNPINEPLSSFSDAMREYMRQSSFPEEALSMEPEPVRVGSAQPVAVLAPEPILSSLTMRTEVGHNEYRTPTKTASPISTKPSIADSFVPVVVPRKQHKKNEPMAEGYVPGSYDIICGDRSKHAMNHVGNRRFKIIINMHLDKYRHAPSRVDKTLIVISIVDWIRQSDPCGHFVRKDRRTGTWVDIGDQQAREKVGYALRDAINLQSDRKTKGR